MKLSRLLSILVVVAVIIAVGTLLIGWGTTLSNGPVRPEARLGDQGPGPIGARREARWTPTEDKNGHSVNLNLPPSDPRISSFADFSVLFPAYIPSGLNLRQAVLYWDPTTKKRMVQFVLQGDRGGLVTEHRVRRRTGEYPQGIRLTSITQPDGTIVRNLESNVEGIGVSIAMSSSVSDDEIIKILKSLHRQ